MLGLGTGSHGILLELVGNEESQPTTDRVNQNLHFNKMTDGYTYQAVLLEAYKRFTKRSRNRVKSREESNSL